MEDEASEINVGLPTHTKIMESMDSSLNESGVEATELVSRNEPMSSGDNLNQLDPAAGNVDPFSQREDSMDPSLYMAAAKGDFYLLGNRIKDLPTLLSPKGNTVLHIHVTAQCGKSNYSTDFLDKILDRCPLLLKQPNTKGEIPLHIAARHGRLRSVNVLIERAKAPYSDLERGVTEARTMLRMADTKQDTALHEAVRFNHLDVVNLLLTTEDSTFSYSANNAGETPLYLAAERGFIQLVDKILETYASPPHGGPSGRTALHAAVIGNYEAMAGKILDRMVALTTERDSQGWTPLHYAAHLGHLSMLKLLLKHDTSAVNLTDGHAQRTALHIAAGRGHSDIVKELISCRPLCWELVDRRGWNVLHFAVESRDRLTVLVVLRNVSLANLLNEKDNNGNTPLHQLVIARNSFIPELIRDPRVDKMAINNENLNALDIREPFSSHGQGCEIVEYLKEAGATAGLRNTTHQDDVEEAKLIMDKEKEVDKEDDKMNFLYKKIVKAEETHLLVATLVVTVSFAASITLPGGYISEKGPDQGTAVLKGDADFGAFVWSNMCAMILSSLAVLLHLLLSLQINKGIFLVQFMIASLSTAVALFFMTFAYPRGLSAVLADYESDIFGSRWPVLVMSITYLGTVLVSILLLLLVWFDLL